MTDSSPTSLGSPEDFRYTSYTLNNNVPELRDIDRIELELQSFDFIVRFFQRHRAACCAVLSSIRRIPLEVLGEVFMFQFAPAETMSKSGRRQLLSLCLVSKGWQQAAYGTHRLWTELQLERPFTDEVRLKAQQWLNRAGSLPKSVSIRAGDMRLGMCMPGNPHCSFANRSMARFLTDGPAITDLTIQCASSSCIRHLLEEMGNVKAPRPTAEVKDDDDNGQSEPSTGGEGEKTNEPTTRTWLSTYRRDFSSNSKDFTLICDWGADKILPVLKSCSNLETFTLDVNHADFVLDPDDPWQTRKDGPSRPPTQRSAKLNLLRFPPDAAAYLQFFRTYSLEEMELHFNGEGIHWNTTWGIAFSSYFERFIQRSQGKGSSNGLRRLTLSSLEITAKEMHRILSKLPSLTHLTLDNVRVPPGLFDPKNLDFIDSADEYVATRDMRSREGRFPFAATKLTII
ncbi:hypothetical protein FA13DRAFT_1804091 [Coprinellus micaceus]|uniref:Uncharacterized protein n=1 Tax=Coprinellus micaceus TaxID=71717 RepID=A0A4Y7S9T4_COPMI|nr:hypothetical protein FA13DRAFT_1804091 [Coprinellus micaceus]